MKAVRYFTKSQLARANHLAIKRGYSHALREDFVASLDDGLKFPIVHTEMRDEACIRVVIGVGEGESDIAMIDCDGEVWRQLSVMAI